MRIAYQGEPGAYSEAAALRFKASADLLPQETFEAVFAAVDEGAATHGILPIENTTYGSIHRNYDLLLQHELPIVGEVTLPIVHNLLALEGTTREQLRRVYSHPQGLAQCERFLRTLDQVELVPTYDTAGSAKMIQDGQLRDTGAIASARAAEVFELSILEAGVQDFAANTTRFLLIGRDAAPLDTANKTTIVFTVSNDAGALFKALSDFAKDHNKKPVFKLGIMDNKVMQAEQVDAIAKLPSRDVLYSMLAGALEAPMAALASALEAKIQETAGLIDALREEREKAG